MKPFLITVLILLLTVFLLWLLMILPRLRRPALLKELRRWKYAHRGLHNIQNGVPENSLRAFQRARDAGYAIELDIHLSKDGKLVVEHDDTLKRTCGTELMIEDADWPALQLLRLQNTEEQLPLLEEVLALVDGTVPLLIELKVVRANYKALCRAAWAMLRHYKGPFCVESFDPRVLGWFRSHAPRVVRGQLAAHVRRVLPEISPFTDFALRNLLINVIGRPDFLAYYVGERKNPSLLLCRFLFRTPLFYWTIRDNEGFRAAERAKAAPIFEEQ